jgi:Glycosyltransferase family 87
MASRRWALILWSVILAVIAVRVTIAPNASTVYPTFSDAGRQWIAGESTYRYIGVALGIDRYRYSPPATLFFAAYSYLPDRIGGILWRGLSAAVFLGGLAALSRWWRPQLSIAAMKLLVIPLAVAGLNNGQANALVAGLLLLATVAFAEGRWTVAAALLVGPVILKAYPLTLGMMFCLIEPRRFAPRLAVCLLIAAAIPYLAQRTEYVNQEYATFYKVLCSDDRTEFGTAGYRDLQSLACRVGMPMKLQTYRGLEMMLGLTGAAIVVAGRRRGWNRRSASSACLALSLCWMTVAGPATESCTYVLIAPILAMAMLTIADRPYWQRWLVRSSFALFIVGAIVVWFPPRVHRAVQDAGIQPLAGLLLTAHVITECWRLFRNGGLSTQTNDAHFLSTFGKSANSSRTAA